MGVYIQTATGLVKVAGNAEVSAATIVAALGYTPAKNSALTSHKNDTDAHITAEERTAWNNKAEADHNHDEDYAPKEHTHSNYALTTHNHDSTYAAKDHDHNNVAKTKTYDLSSTADITNSKESQTYGFSYSSSYGGLYPGNRGVKNSFAYAKITFTMPADGTLTMTVYQSSEKNYDYGWVSYLDMNLPKSTTTTVDSTVKYNAKGLDGTATVTYTGVTKGQHYITVRYRKDSSSDSGSDTFTIKSLVASYTLSEYAAYDHNHDEDYAAKEHTHTDYASTTHNHDEDYAAKEHNHDETYAAKEHNHDDAYAPTDHNHDYNELENKPNIESSDSDDSLSIVDSKGNVIAKIDANGVDSVDFKINGVSIKDLIAGGETTDLSDYYTKEETNSAINNAVKDKADAGHNHDELYAPKEHTHSEYAQADHNHDETYAAKEHNHSEYADSNHNHDETYAVKEHDHDEYAEKEHNHDETYAAKEHDHDEYAEKEHIHSGTAISYTYDLATALDITNSNESCNYGFSYDSVLGGLSPTNKGVDKSFAYTKLIFTMPEYGSLTLSFNQSSENKYDYGWVSNLDMDLPKDYETTTEDSTVKYNAKDIDGAGSVTYENVSKGQHYITVRYRKDSSTSNGDDTFTITSLVATHMENAYISAAEVYDMISAYMTENYENGDTGSY